MKTTTRFQAFMLNMADSIDQIGHIRLANLYSAEYEADRLTESQCRTLRFHLASLYAKLYGCEEAQKFIGVEPIDLSDYIGHESPLYNKYRLENNQATKWIDEPIHDHPPVQLMLPDWQGMAYGV